MRHGVNALRHFFTDGPRRAGGGSAAGDEPTREARRDAGPAEAGRTAQASESVGESAWTGQPGSAPARWRCGPGVRDLGDQSELAGVALADAGELSDDEDEGVSELDEPEDAFFW